MSGLQYAGRRWLANSLLDSHLGPGVLHEALALEHSSCDSLLLDSGYAPFGLQETPHSCSSDLSADKAEPAEGEGAGPQRLELAKQDSAMQYKVPDPAGNADLAGDPGSWPRSGLFDTQEATEQHDQAPCEAAGADHDQRSADALQPECRIVEAPLAVAKERVTGSDEKVETSRPASPGQRYVLPEASTSMTSFDLLSSMERPHTGPDMPFPFPEPSRANLATAQCFYYQMSLLCSPCTEASHYYCRLAVRFSTLRPSNLRFSTLLLSTLPLSALRLSILPPPASTDSLTRHPSSPLQSWKSPGGAGSLSHHRRPPRP